MEGKISGLDTRNFLIEYIGAGEGTQTAIGWFDVIKKVTQDMYDNPSIKDYRDVKDLLEKGLDDRDGWNGKRVVLNFEDGSVIVTLV